MAIYEVNKAHYANRLHDLLPTLLGGNAVDYKVHFGGFSPEDGTPRPNYLYVESDVPSQADLVAVVDSHNSLVVTSDKATITADNVDTATITCADGVISGDANVDVTVWLDGGEYMATTAEAVVGGEVELTLATNESGTYLIEIHRQNDFESGYIEIVAT